MKTFKEFLKESLNMRQDVKMLSDDDLMEFIDEIENMRKPNPDNEDARQDVLKKAYAEMKKRGFSIPKRSN